MWPAHIAVSILLFFSLKLPWPWPWGLVLLYWFLLVCYYVVEELRDQLKHG